MVTSRAALRLSTFDQAPSLHPSTGEGFSQGPKLRHVFFLWKSFAKIFKFVVPVPTYILNHPFFIIITLTLWTNFLFSLQVRLQDIFFKKKIVIPINKIIIHCTYCVPSHWRRASSLF